MNEICPDCGQPMTADECASLRLTRHKRDQDRAFWEGYGGLPGPSLAAAYNECDRLERERDEATATSRRRAKRNERTHRML